MLPEPRSALARYRQFGRSRIAMLEPSPPPRADQLTVFFHHLLALRLRKRIEVWTAQEARTQAVWAAQQGFDRYELSRVLNGRAYLPSWWLGPLWDLHDPDLVPTVDDVALLLPHVQPGLRANRFPDGLKYKPTSPLPRRGFEVSEPPGSPIGTQIARARGVVPARDDPGVNTPDKDQTNSSQPALERIAHQWIVHTHATHPAIAPQERAETPTVEVVVTVGSPAAPRADGSLLTDDCFLHLDVPADWGRKVDARGHALIDGHIILDVIDEQDGRPNYVVAVRDDVVIDVAMYAEVAWVRWDSDGPRLRWTTD